MDSFESLYKVPLSFTGNQITCPRDYEEGTFEHTYVEELSKIFQHNRKSTRRPEGILASAAYLFVARKLEVDPFVFQKINSVADATYEKRKNIGCLVFSKEQPNNLDIKLESSIDFLQCPLSELRKLIEMSSFHACLCIVNSKIVGIGQLKGVQIQFLGDAKWCMIDDKKTLLTVKNGIPLWIEDKIQTEQYTDAFTKENYSKFKDLIEQVKKLDHGTMLVFSQHAEDEAKRLSARCYKIAKNKVTVGIIEVASKIDGAILMDFDLNCYAIGVIVDGLVIPNEGNKARGSRYNSGLIYAQSKKNTVVVVISDDGTTDVFYYKGEQSC